MRNYVDFVPTRMARGTIMCTWVLNNRNLSNHAKVLFVILSEYARDKHVCYPSLSTLKERMFCSLNSLKKYLRELIDLKFVAFENKKFFLYCPKLSNFDNQVSSFDSKINNINKLTNTPPISPSEGNQTSHNLTPLLKTSHGRHKPHPNPCEGDFNLFWNVYPRKENKTAAFRKFLALKSKKQLPTLEFFKKAIEFFRNSKQWNREEGRFIPQLANFLENEKWQEVPTEFFEPKKDLSIHQNVVSLVEATRQWEHDKQRLLSSNSKNTQTSELLENNWNEFQSKFKTDRSLKRFFAKAKFIDLSLHGFSFGVIEKNMSITPMEYLAKLSS